MTTDDLTRPLGRKSKIRGGSFPFRRIAAALVAAVLLLLGGWLVMVDDPDGGEPVAVVSLDRAVPAAVDPITVATVAPSVEPAAPINPNEIIIRDAAVGGEIRLFIEAVDGLLERTPYGMVPRIGSSGIRPVDAYARPDPNDGAVAAARIALVLTGLGRDDEATAAAVNRLPGAASLAFSPLGADLDRWVAQARNAGHEVLLELPSAAGAAAGPTEPRLLVASAGAAANLDRLYWLMSRMTRYAGVVGAMDAGFLADAGALEPLMAEIGARGLLYVDDGRVEASMAPEIAAGHLPLAIGDVTIDGDAPLALVEQRIGELEAMAMERGSAVGIVAATPLTVEALARWIARLRGRGIELVPVTALARD